MDKDTIAILVIVGLAVFVWLPAIIISSRKALKNDTLKNHEERQSPPSFPTCSGISNEINQ